MRFQRVVVSESYSSWSPVTSVLGPLLFLLNVDNFTTVLRVCKLKLFADDVLLYFNVNSVKDCRVL